LCSVSTSVMLRVEVAVSNEAVLPKRSSPPLPPDTADRGMVASATAPESPVMVMPVLLEGTKSTLVTSVTVIVLVPPASGMFCPISAVVKKIS